MPPKVKVLSNSDTVSKSQFDGVMAFIGLGSNLSDPVEQIKTAKASINKSDGILEWAFSSLYRSVPMGPANQPGYVNAVMAVETTLSARDLLRVMQKIENSQGRVRGAERWGARTLDLDLLLYGQDIIETEELTVPHYGLTERAFVLYPLAEISPNLTVPNKGALDELLKCCPRDGLSVIS